MNNSVIECVKVSNIFIGLKKTCLGGLDTGKRDNNNETCLKEGGGIKMSTTVLHSRCSLLRLNTYHSSVQYLNVDCSPL